MLSSTSAIKKTSLSNPQVSLWQYIEHDILWMHREAHNSTLCYLAMSFEWMQNHMDLTIVRLADCKTSAPHGILCSRSCKMPERSATVSGPSVAVTSNFLMWLNKDSTQPISSCNMCEHTNVSCSVHVCHSVPHCDITTKLFTIHCAWHALNAQWGTQLTFLLIECVVWKEGQQSERTIHQHANWDMRSS